jgi:TPR repeat protein
MNQRAGLIVFIFVMSVILFPAARAQTSGQRGTALDPQPLPTWAKNGSYYALIIGINQYRPPLPILKTAVDDARSLAKVLSEHYGFQVKLLLNENATRKNILDTLVHYRGSLQENDNLLIYYAGHGNSDPEANKAYWLPADAESDTTSNWIIADELTTDIRGLPARHVLIISDSCYSGDLTREANFDMGANDEKAFLRKKMANKSRTLMSSGGDEPVADTGPGGHSAFAGALLKGLEHVDENTFTAERFFHEFVQQQVAGKYNQDPQYIYIHNSGHDNGDFVFIRSVVPGHVVTEESQPKQPPGNLSAAGPVAGHEVAERTNPAPEPAEYEQAFRTYQREAGNGNVAAMTSLGYQYELGHGAKQDYGQAMQWYKKAATGGDSGAMYSIGSLYADGNGVPQDYQQARQWYEKAAARGESRSMEQLGAFYVQGEGVPVDYVQARQWFEKGAESGNPQAMNNLGFIFEKGYGVAPDYQKARQWYEKGAAAGEASAISNLGALYAMGKGVPVDYVRARQLYEKGAAMGDAGSMRSLAALYENGDGVTMNINQARALYEKAAALGDQIAQERLKVLSGSIP